MKKTYTDKRANGMAQVRKMNGDGSKKIGKRIADSVKAKSKTKK